ncbi:hypothetical protein [Massilia sp. LC238]|uniref:hypothetical protein n=1 Tax=Massilia sp. LC238 TaxID=1502852 RepID=UPI0004E3AE89|nr:hypothetical protein [Massilia sp. LC238]KFC76259.1 hypothetical protein FG94_00356 [Massilia sp. LC238]
MRLSKLIVLVLAISSQAGCRVVERIGESRTCPTIPVPEDSVVIGEENTPLPLLVLYPKRLAKDFSGCAYAWLAEDAALNGTELHSIARFEKGVVVDGLISDSIGPSMVNCAARNREEHPALCGSFDQFWRDTIAMPPPETYTRKSRRTGP